MEYARSTITPASIREELRCRQRARNRGSCFPCRERKVRCNRQHPCLSCTKRGDTDLCIYSESCAMSDARSQPPEMPSGREHPRPSNLESPLSPSELKSMAQNSFVPRSPASLSPTGDTLLQGYSLIALGDTNGRDALEDAIAPLLGMGEQERTSRDCETSLANSVYATLPGDKELIQLFTVFSLRIHPFQPIIDDLDAVERLMCGVITQRSFPEKAHCPQEPSTPRHAVRFLCLLHAVLAAGAQFSDQSVEQRLEASRKHGMLHTLHILLPPNS